MFLAVLERLLPESEFLAVAPPPAPVRTLGFFLESEDFVEEDARSGGNKSWMEGSFAMLGAGLDKSSSSTRLSFESDLALLLLLLVVEASVALAFEAGAVDGGGEVKMAGPGLAPKNCSHDDRLVWSLRESFSSTASSSLL